MTDRPSLWTVGALLALTLVMAGCKPKKDKLAEFAAKCTAAEFTPAQCEVLMMLYAEAINAGESADIAAINAAAGIAIGAVGSGRR